MNKVYLKSNSFITLRILCCFIVIFCHVCTLSSYTSEIINLINPAHIAVCVFFILSGFWITYSYLRCESIWDFYKKRIYRIFPAYLFVVLFFSFFLVFFSEFTYKDYFINRDFILYIFSNVLTLNFLHPNLPGVFTNNIINAVNGSLWTIKIELGFYLILPLLFYFIKKKTIITLISIYIFSIIYQETMPIICQRFSLPEALINQLPAFLSYFVSGIFCYLYSEELQAKWKKYICVSFIIIIIHFITQTEILFPFVLSIFVILLGINIKQNFINVDFSYEMYLCHFPIIQIFISKEILNTNIIGLYITVVIISLIFAYIIKLFTKLVGSKL